MWDDGIALWDAEDANGKLYRFIVYATGPSDWSELRLYFQCIDSAPGKVLFTVNVRYFPEVDGQPPILAWIATDPIVDAFFVCVSKGLSTYIAVELTDAWDASRKANPSLTGAARWRDVLQRLKSLLTNASLKKLTASMLISCSI